jgi:hypothetical protein
MFSTFQITGCVGRSDLLKISIHDREGKMITIHVGLDCKLLGIAQCLLTFLQPMLDGAHNTLRA